MYFITRYSKKCEFIIVLLIILNNYLYLFFIGLKIIIISLLRLLTR